MPHGWEHTALAVRAGRAGRAVIPVFSTRSGWALNRYLACPCYPLDSVRADRELICITKEQRLGNPDLLGFPERPHLAASL